MITQSFALLLDAWRELNSKRIFWIVLILSGLVVAVFLAAGIDAQQNLTLLGMRTPIPVFMERGEFYKQMFVTFGIEIWLSLAATILAIISTASIFPDFISNGAVDLYLSKPLGRFRLFLTKYLAGILFVALQVSVFCVASFFVVGIRGGAWEPRILLGIPIVLCFFSYLYVISVLFGILTRSTIAAVLLTVLMWFLVFIVHGSEIATRTFQFASKREMASAEKTLVVVNGQIGFIEKQSPEQQQKSSEILANLQRQREELQGKIDSSPRKNLDLAHQILYNVKTVLPKTSETTALLSRSLISEPEPSEDDDQPRRRKGRPGHPTRSDQEAVEAEIRSRPISWVIGTSLIFEAVVLGLAAWVFCRRDY